MFHFSDWSRKVSCGILFLAFVWLTPVKPICGAEKPDAGTQKSSDPVDASKATQEEFSEHVQPLLVSRCLKCHNPFESKGGLDLTQRKHLLEGGDTGPAINVAALDESLLIDRVSFGEMPPDEPLDKEQVALLTRWVKSGATYTRSIPFDIKRAGPDFWSLQKPLAVAPPDVQDADWVRNPIDRFVLAKLEENGLKPSPETDRRTFLRRVKFDMLGLPPTPEEVHEFEADTSDKAYEKLVDRLLASPHYGERWGRHWLDVVRFGESHGYETNALRPNAWPYRDYVINAFNRDIPYPQFILEQLAGDTVAAGNPHIEVATGFLVGGTHDIVGNQTLEGKLKQRADDLDDMLSTTSLTFLGLTVGCARCHDHKFDPILQKDYYGLQAIFAGVNHAERQLTIPDDPTRETQIAALRERLAEIDRAFSQFEPLATLEEPSVFRSPVNPRRNVDRFAPVVAKQVRMTIRATARSQPCLDEFEIFTAESTPRNVALESLGGSASASSNLPNYPIHQIKHLNDGRAGNSHSWISNEQGKGWARIDLAEAVTIDRVIWSRDREGKYSDRLATDYVIEVSQDGENWTPVASSADRIPLNGKATPDSTAGLSPQEAAKRKELQTEKNKVTEQIASLTRSPMAYAGTFTQPGPTHLLRRGDPMLPGDVVPPSSVRAFGGDVLPSDLPEQDRRKALAKWIGNRDNPLTARVLVNRVWQHHFGRGIVATPNDFGFNGSRPSHSELLDWLAVEFMNAGWQMKPLHRLVVLSATYRQSSTPNPAGLKADGASRLLWRFPLQRLEAEVVRDTILAVTGKLNPKMGGPGYNVWEPNTNYVAIFKYKPELGPEEFRRMIYQFKPRAEQDATFGVFDCPDASFSMPRRFASTTVLQALNLLNSTFMLRQADFFAERLEREAGDSTESRITRAFELAFNRAPSATERKAATSLVEAHGLPAFCRALLNASELIYVQ